MGGVECLQDYTWNHLVRDLSDISMTKDVTRSHLAQTKTAALEIDGIKALECRLRRPDRP